MSYPTRDGNVTAVFYLQDDGTVLGIDHPEDPRIEKLLRQFQESTTTLRAENRAIADGAFLKVLRNLFASL